MSLATLLVAPGADRRSQETFSFDHAFAHRVTFGAMATEQYGLSRFSVLPYKLDPNYLVQGGWKLDHGQAHHDFVATLPGAIIWWFGLVIQLPTQYLSINSGQNYIDPDLTRREQMQWWTFANHQDHLIAQSVVPSQAQLIFPFW